MKIFNKYLIIFILIGIISPFFTFAAIKPLKNGREFLYGAWLPYWKEKEALAEIFSNIQKFNELSPFSYEVSSDGKLIDKFKINDELWVKFLNEHKNSRLKIIPTIAWFNRNQIHEILKNPKTRESHIEEIVSLVETKNFDGIDIDYENKKAETSISFSKFIKSLSEKLHKNKKILSCSVEARTPLASRLKVIPKDFKYANDYYVLSKYCDEVRVLAYGQGKIDLLLNEKKGNKGKFYAPVSDNDWVEKVIKETKRYIVPQKIMLGIPTFGYEYEYKKSDNGKIVYEKIRSVTYKSAVDLASSLNLKPARNSAYELSFTYATSSLIENKNTVATSTENLFATSTRLVVFNDAVSMSDKIKIAKKHKFRGVVFFKFDGETDSELWKKF